ncbi:MAG: hypothetical protein WC091_25580 [Sulfuricellaceae bacterium]
MATTPSYAATPNCAIANITTANTARDGTGIVSPVFTVGASGSMVSRLSIGAGGVGDATGAGASGGASQIVQAGHVIMIASGGFGAVDANRPGLDQTAYYFEGTPLAVVPGKRGGVGNGGYAGSGGGGGGLSAQNTAGSSAVAGASSLGGSGSMGAMTPGVYASAGVAPPLGLPESGSGGTTNDSTSMSSMGVSSGFAGAQGSGGSGGCKMRNTQYVQPNIPGGNGGAGFVMIKY